MKLSPKDKWAILSPGRTGSKVIVDCICSAYSDQGITLEYIPPESELSATPDLSTFTNGYIVHTHQYELYTPLVENSINVVINTRDMVDSTISWCIQSHIGSWHLYSNEEYKSVRIVPFHLNMDVFYERYDAALMFYKNLAKSLTKYYPNRKIIDYSEFENDANSLFELLDIEYDGSIKTPLKNPGSSEAWISNWHSIQTELYRLKRIPEIR